MPKTDKRVDAYIAKSADFAKPILPHLRALVHQGCPAVEETWKWSFPHFTYRGMMCSMAAFKEHCAFGFWKSELVFGKESHAVARKESMGHFGRITSMANLPPDAVLIEYIKKAAAVNEAGIKKPVEKKKAATRVLEIPDYFMAALRKNKKALATFEAYPYSHKKEYVQWVTEAKRDETRDRRLAQTVTRLAEGKTRNAEYERC